MFAIPATDGLDVISKIIEELPSGFGDVPAECTGVVPATEQHDMVHLQQCFEAIATKQVEAVIDYGIEKFVGCKHVLPHRISKIITPAIKYRINGMEMALHIVQLILDPSQVQAHRVTTAS